MSSRLLVLAVHRALHNPIYAPSAPLCFFLVGPIPGRPAKQTRTTIRAPMLQRAPGRIRNPPARHADMTHNRSLRIPPSAQPEVRLVFPIMRPQRDKLHRQEWRSEPPVMASVPGWIRNPPARYAFPNRRPQHHLSFRARSQQSASSSSGTAHASSNLGEQTPSSSVTWPWDARGHCQDSAGSSEPSSSRLQLLETSGDKRTFMQMLDCEDATRQGGVLLLLPWLPPR